MGQEVNEVRLRKLGRDMRQEELCEDGLELLAGGIEVADDHLEKRIVTAKTAIRNGISRPRTVTARAVVFVLRFHGPE